MKSVLIILITSIVLITGWIVMNKYAPKSLQNIAKKTQDTAQDTAGGIISQVHPLSIESLRKGEYPGSDFVVEQELDPGSNYSRQIVSYKSEGLKIYGLLTVPQDASASPFPVVIFNHGYIPPAEYRTTEKYVAYQDAFASNGYITFKSDYRGHGNSEGAARGGYGNNDYTIDVLNALSSVKRMSESDDDRIGFWGHSMGGYITLRSMVAQKDIKAAVIWSGVVASYPDLINNWRRRISPSQPLPSSARRWRDVLVEQYGEPNDSDPFWKSLSANNYLIDVSGPIQIHHGTADSSVPVAFSQKLEKQLKDAGKTVEYYEYPGDDHNLAGNFNTAIQRSVEFFDSHVKNK